VAATYFRAKELHYHRPPSLQSRRRPKWSFSFIEYRISRWVQRG